MVVRYCVILLMVVCMWLIRDALGENDVVFDGNQGAGYADHTHGNGAEVAQDPLSLPSGPITRLRAKRFKEALNGLIQENWANSKKTKMGSNNNQGLVHVIKAIEEDN
jgi:hypothetical protein